MTFGIWIRTLANKYPIPKEATLQAIEEAFTYSPTITSEQAKHIIDELKTLRKLKAGMEIYKAKIYSAEFLYEMLK